MVRTHGRSLDFFLPQKVRPVQLNIGANRHHADDRRCAAPAQRPERLLRRQFQADCFKRILHAAIGQRADLLDRVAIGWVDHIRGAEFLGQVQFRTHHVDGDDLTRSGNLGAVDGG